MRPLPFCRLHPLALAGATALTVCSAAAQTPAAPEPAASAPTVLPPVVVNASADASAQGLTKPYAGGQVARGGRAGLLGNKDFMDTPFAGTSYTQALIQDQQAKSVADVLLNDPAVRNARGFGNFQEVYVIRGFPIFSDDMAYNGLYGLLPRQYVATELLERVEVLRGPTAFLNGAAPGGSGLGGSINLLPKRAPDAPLTEVTAGVESGGQALVSADLARRFGPDRATGVRINVARRDGETAVDDEERELDLFAIGLDWRGRGVRLSADLGHQHHRLDAPRPSVTPAGGIPDAPDASDNFAQRWTSSRERTTFGTLRAEFDVGEAATVWAAAGLRHGDESNVLANPSATPDGTLSGGRFDNARKDRAGTGELGVRGTLATGPVRHELSAVAAHFRQSSRNAFALSSATATAGSLDDPVQVAPPPATAVVGGDLDSPGVTQRSQTTSFALADTLHFFDDRVQLTLGLRRQRIEDRSYDFNTGDQTASYGASRTTPAVGLLVKATDQLSVYANHVEGLQRGEVAPQIANAPGGGTVPVTNSGDVFAPYETKQSEIGLKYDGGRFSAQAALFRITKPVGSIAFNEDGTAARFVVGDDQRHQGLELSVFGEPLRGLRLLGGLNLIDAEISRTGKDAIGVPDTQVNLGAEWLVPGVPGLALSSRVIHTSSQAASADNALELPSWTRIDVGARYGFSLGGQDLTLRARIDNLADRDYWASTGGFPGANYLVLGGPRTVVVSLTAAF